MNYLYDATDNNLQLYASTPSHYYPLNFNISANRMYNPSRSLKIKIFDVLMSEHLFTQSIETYTMWMRMKTTIM